MLGFEALSVRLPFVQKYIIYFSDMDSFLSLAIAVGLLGLFKDLEMEHLKWVDMIASGTFGVCLIYENEFMRQLLWLWPHSLWAGLSAGHTDVLRHPAPGKQRTSSPLPWPPR